MIPPSPFSYRMGLGTCDALLTLSHSLQVALDRGLVQLGFSPAFDKVSHCDPLYKLMSIGVGGQFLSIVPEFLNSARAFG